MKSTSCLGAIAALTIGASLAGEASAQSPYDHVYWPLFSGWTYAQPAPPPRPAARSLPPRRTVADNSIRPLMTFSPSLIFGVGY